MHILEDLGARRLRNGLEQQVKRAGTNGRVRNALFDRGAFYLLWHGGLRLGEVEELRLEDPTHGWTLGWLAHLVKNRLILFL